MYSCNPTSLFGKDKNIHQGSFNGPSGQKSQWRLSPNFILMSPSWNPDVQWYRKNKHGMIIRDSYQEDIYKISYNFNLYLCHWSNYLRTVTIQGNNCLIFKILTFCLEFTRLCFGIFLLIIFLLVPFFLCFNTTDL